MEEFCTCGARLVEDARFCHKCGRPLRAEDVEREAALQQPVAPPPPPPEPAETARAPLRIGLRNSTAVRTALIAAGTLCVLMVVPLPAPLSLIWQILLLVGSGFGSVYLYSRRTGQFLSPVAGARMGWLTGLFAFLIVAVFLTLGLVGWTIVGAPPGLAARPGGDEMIRAIEQMLSSPIYLVMMFASSFVLLTLLPMLGGLLCAKVLEKD